MPTFNGRGLSLDAWSDVWWLILPGAAAIFATVWLVRRRNERERTEAIRQASLHLGMSFVAEDEGLASQSFSGLPLFQKGDSTKTKNVLRGSSGDGEVVVCDYDYTVSHGETSNTFRQTVAAFRLRAELPDFSMSPENILHRIGEVFGMQDIDFETHPEFSRSYRLRGSDEAAIRELFGSAVLEHFTNERGWSLEGGGEWLVIYRASKRVAPEDLAAFLQQTTGIARVFRDR